MPTISICMVLFAATLTVCHGDCNFPQKWGADHWLIHYIYPINNTGLHVKYDVSSYSTFSSVAPGITIDKFTCDAFETSGVYNYYIRRKMGTSGPVERHCVVDVQTDNVIVHKESLYNESFGSATLEKCKTALAQEELYSVYLPVSPLMNKAGPTFDFPANRQPFPFTPRPYRVTYIPPGDNSAVTCADDVNSVANAGSTSISILACKYRTYFYLPLTGIINLLSVINPTILGEPDVSDGMILILTWFSRSLPHMRIMSARCKVENNADVTMSIDLTSAEPETPVQIRKGHRFNEHGDIKGRKHFSLTLLYDAGLASKPTIASTATTRPMPGSSTTPVFEPDVHVQITMYLEYEAVTDKDELQMLLDGTRSGVSELTEIPTTRMSKLKAIRGRDGSAVVQFDLTDGVPSIAVAAKKLRDAVNTGVTAIVKSDGVAVGMIAESVYVWRDDDPCKERKCANGGKCMVLQGHYKCDCPVLFTGPHCMERYEPTTGSKPISDEPTERTTYIIIGVVVTLVLIGVTIGIIVFCVIRHNRRKTTGSQDDQNSETGYSMEDRDREIYSTIHKKPKAFHEQSFTSVNGGHGEKTGIHM